jgi:hypothetical protein
MDAVIGSAGQLPADTTELTNVDPALLRAWHPVALAEQVGAGPVQVMVVGRLWTVRRISGRVVADPVPYGLRERFGLVWLAAREPVTELLDDPELVDRHATGGWLPPVRTGAPAGLVVEILLGERPGARVQPEPYGLRAVHGRHRYHFRAPFQLLRGVEVAETGLVRTVLRVVAPESLDNSRLYTKVLLRGDGPIGAAALARELAAEEAVRDQELAALHTASQARLSEPAAEAGPFGTALRAELRRLVERAGPVDLH